MPLEKTLRVERASSAGIVLSGPELQQFVTGSEADGTDHYVDRVESALDKVAATAQEAGRAACTNADCKVVCSGLSLLDTVSEYDADLTARCTLPNCDDSGVLASCESFSGEIAE